MTAFDVMGGSLIFMMCCWQIPKLFAAVIGGSPALTGGDLVATVRLSAAQFCSRRRGGRWSGCLAGGGMPARAPDLRRAQEVLAPAQQRRLRASDRSERVVGRRRLGVAAFIASPGFVANGAGARRQPDPPSGGSGDASCAVDPPIGDHSRVARARSENVSSGEAQPLKSPPSVSSALSSIGGEPLAGSGFETQPAQRGFAPASVNASDGAAHRAGPSSLSAARRERALMPCRQCQLGAAPSNSAGPGSSGAASEVASVGARVPQIRNRPARRKEERA